MINRSSAARGIKPITYWSIHRALNLIYDVFDQLPTDCSGSNERNLCHLRPEISIIRTGGSLQDLRFQGCLFDTRVDISVLNASAALGSNDRWLDLELIIVHKCLLGMRQALIALALYYFMTQSGGRKDFFRNQCCPTFFSKSQLKSLNLDHHLCV